MALHSLFGRRDKQPFDYVEFEKEKDEMLEYLRSRLFSEGYEWGVKIYPVIGALCVELKDGGCCNGVGFPDNVKKIVDSAMDIFEYNPVLPR